MDISFGELMNLYNSEELIIRPEYQRLFRCTNAQKNGLIESILLAIPVPPIFVAEDSNGIWELESGSLIAELEGFTANILPQKYLINIKRAVCRVEIFRGESNTAMKYELFKRLNSGGSKLTAQEIRNTIYRGIDSSVNELVEELSKNLNFLKFTQLSKQKSKSYMIKN